MVITLKAEDVVEEGSTQIDPGVLRGWFRRSARSKSQSVYKSALELPQNQDVKSKLMNKKPK